MGERKRDGNVVSLEQEKQERRHQMESLNSEINCKLDKLDNKIDSEIKNLNSQIKAEISTSQNKIVKWLIGSIVIGIAGIAITVMAIYVPWINEKFSIIESQMDKNWSHLSERIDRLHLRFDRLTEARGLGHSVNVGRNQTTNTNDKSIQNIQEMSSEVKQDLSQTAEVKD